jgi:hypothetical protein
VVTGDEVTQPHKESARLRRALDDIVMAIDIVVVPETVLEQLRSQAGLIYREACEFGTVVYERPD